MGVQHDGAELRQRKTNGDTQKLVITDEGKKKDQLLDQHTT